MNRKQQVERRRRPRSCVGCKKERPKKDLLRIVREPDGNIAIDHTGRKPGRGAYICLNGDCLKLARKKRSLSSALGCEISDDFYEEISDLIAHKKEGDKAQNPYHPSDPILPVLGIARRSGALIIGFDRISSNLNRGKRLIVILSEETSAQVMKSLRSYEERGQTRLFKINGLTRKELGNALGMGAVQLIALPEEHGLSYKVLQMLSQGGDAVE